MPDQIYEQVAADLERRIDNGEFPPGSRLPSRAQLREQYAHLSTRPLLSGNVVDKAMMILRARGLTDTLPGVAVYVRERP